MLTIYVENSRLTQIVASTEKVAVRIRNELSAIEKRNNLSTQNNLTSIEQRIRHINNYYITKENDFTAIGDRMSQIENIIGLKPKIYTADRDVLEQRVETANFTARQERILHDSIPNGSPTVNNLITSKYGYRNDPLTTVKKFHKGVDLRAKLGTNIYATADGIVAVAGYSKTHGYHIIIQHNFGFDSRYTHLKKRFVKTGDFVEKGDLISLSGNSGRSQAPHLHYEVRYLGKALDPVPFLKWEYGDHKIFTHVRKIKWPSLISQINKLITHQTLQLSQLEQN